MKRIILALALSFMAVQSRAEGTSLFNFGDFIHQLRAGYAVNQHGQKGEVYYTSIITVHNRNAIDLVSFNVGYEGIGKHPTIMMGMRLDNMIPLLFNGEWGKAHVSTAKLPTFECGPFVSVWPKDSDNFWNMSVNYGIGAAIGF